MLGCAIRRLSVVFMEYVVAKQCVLEQKLLLTAYMRLYEKSIGTTTHLGTTVTFV